MWGWILGKRGYCGEASFQSHGIFYGNWITQEIVRNSADRHELLIGNNDVKAANELKFKYENFPSRGAKEGQQFVDWTSTQIDKGNVVVAGFGDKWPAEDYKHIMPIVGYKKDSAGKILGLFYNDLYITTGPLYRTPATECLVTPPVDLPHFYCIPTGPIYAIALQGNVDTENVTERMKIIIKDEDEPDWGVEDKLNEAPIKMNISGQIVGLTPGSNYTILRFESPSQVPTSKFVESMKWTKSWQFTATSNIYDAVDFDTFMSNSSIFYRVVEFNGVLERTNTP